MVTPLAMQQYMLLQRNLVYTGITRGKKLVVLVSENSCIPIRTPVSVCSKASSTEIVSDNIARGPFHCDTNISRTERPQGDNS